MPSIINAATSGGLISTADTSGVLQLQTASTTALTITAAQNVGIGTASPGTRLQIGNPSDANQALRFDFSDSSTARINSTRLASGNLQSLLLAGQDTVQFQANGTEICRVAANGLGIGTTSPGAKLTVSGSGNIARFGDGTNTFNIRFVGPNNWMQQLDTATDVFSIQRNSTDFFSINPSGSAVLRGAVTSADGIGITFPATQSSSSNANTLDDYEEGTFTPTYFGSTTAGTTTYAAGGQEGSYVKIGNRVYCELCLNWSNQTGTGDGLVGGLPFVVGGYSPDSRSLFLMPAYQGYSITGILTGITQSAGTTIILYAINNGSLAGSGRQTSGLIRCQFWYITST